ncbi:hypothetical protein V3C99_002209 [Haemonchus contortus]|uniref:Ovule protein n=1 Tax=Haemonchus contortus TaxID=6289 RepID=A0A7I4Y9P5_HAECO
MVEPRRHPLFVQSLRAFDAMYISIYNPQVWCVCLYVCMYVCMFVCMFNVKFSITWYHLENNFRDRGKLWMGGA